MVALDGLQGLGGVARLVFHLPQGAEITHTRGNEFFGVFLDGFHGSVQEVIGVDHITVVTVQDGELARRDFHAVDLSAFMDDEMVVSRGAVRHERGADRFAGRLRGQHRARNEDARDADARIVGVDRVAELRDPVGVEPDVGQQPAVRHGEIRRLVLWRGVDHHHVVLVFGQPVFVVRAQHVTVCRALFVHRETGAARKMERVHRHGFHGVQHAQVVERHLRALSHALDLVHILRIFFLRERDELARLDLRALPGEREFGVGLFQQDLGVANAVRDLPFGGLAELPSHFAVRAGDADDRRRGGVDGRVP
ncbi:MAG: hypothetical protein PGMFKBFP_01561 [Anaerolineales bacterium]|nr:hypothetical protein [Anaerolineales bacterium]